MPERTARCSGFRTCGSTATSSRDLSFFEDLSSPQDSCAHPGTNGRGECGYTASAHDLAVAEPKRTYIAALRTHGYVAQPGGFEHDRFYCGCRGWD